MKRIIFTVTNDLNNDQRMHKICGSLQSAGYDTFLVGRERKASKPLTLQKFSQKRLKCFFEKGKLFYTEYNIRLLWFLLFRKSDIICAVDLDTIVPCTLAGKLKSAKLVYDAHEYFTEVPELMHRPGVQKMWKWVEKIFVPKMDACYTVSNSLAELYEQKYDKHFEVIMNVPVLRERETETERGKESAKETVRKSGGEGNGPERFILYQGALNKGRGLEMLIDSMKQLPLKLVLAGDGDLTDELKKQVEQAGLSEKVQFTGMLDPEDLEVLTRKAWLGYNLLENLGASYYFSLSNKFFDYIHACVPGLSNHFPEYGAINSKYNTGILTNLSVPGIVLCVEKLLNDCDYYEMLRENCKIARKIFNWQAEEQKLITIYNALT